MTLNQPHLLLHVVFLAALALGGCAVDAASGFDDVERPNVSTEGQDGNHNWRLEIEGVTQGSFDEVSGLDTGTRLVVLHGPKDLSPSFLEWLDKCAKGDASSRDFELRTHDDQGNPVLFRLIGAQPQTAQSGKDNSALTEEIEMVIERLERG